MDLILKREDKEPIQGQQFYTTHDAKTLSFKLTTTGTLVALPIHAEDTDPVPETQPAPGYDETFEITTMQNSVKITETLMSTDLSGGRARDMLTGLPASGRRWLEYAFADPINAGATTTGADGVAFYASNHPHEDKRGGTWDNLETGSDLTTTTLNTMYNNMQSRKNELGQPSPITMEMLMGPVGLRMKMAQLARSGKVPEVSLNAVNVFEGLKFMVYHYLTDTDAWLGWGDLPQSMWGLHYVVHKPPTIGKLALPSETHPHIRSGFWIKMQVVAGGSVLKNIHFNPGP